MRFLIFYKTALLRHFDTTFRHLAEEGHELVLASPHEDITSKTFDLSGLPNARVVPDDSGKGNRSRSVMVVRNARNFVRYLDPQLESGIANRERAWKRLASRVSRGSRPELPPVPWLELTDRERRTLHETFDALEGLIPADEQAVEFVASHRPDAVLVTPLVSLSAPQTDVVKAARSLGIPCGLLVFSWDNLSNKGVMHVRPHKVFVWNDVQRREAVELHGMRERDVVVTGAPRFDEFFEMKPSRKRAQKQYLGVDSGRKLILYLGSAPFVTTSEPQILEAWLEARERASDPLVREATVLVRPHPRSRAVWAGWTGRFREGVMLEERPSMYQLQGLYDQISGADAVVGLNTSAQIEASIVGKPVYTFDAGELAPGQEGSTHFYYLLREHGGFVEHARDLAEHFDQLGAGLRGEYDREAIARFAESFVRPLGVDQPATPILAKAIVDLAGIQVAPDKPARGSTPAVSEAEPESPSIVSIDYPAAPIKIHVTSEMERKFRTRPCASEPWTVAWLESNAGPGDVVYDIGANVGTYSMIAATLVREKGGRVLAFEPGATTYSRLCENLALNELDTTVVPLPLLLSRESHLQTLGYRTMEPGQSRHWIDHDDRTSDGGRVHGARYHQPILGMKLDDAIRTFGLPPPSLVKLDVDGGELDVLLGAREALQNPNMRSLMVEVERAIGDDVVAILGELGFELRARHDGGTRPGLEGEEWKSSSWYGEFALATPSAGSRVWNRSRLGSLRWRRMTSRKVASRRRAEAAAARARRIEKGSLPRTADEAAEGVRRELRALTSSDRPIVVGPWLSEVGFELLYWVPFLRWATREAGLDPGRLTVVSRGGVESWYEGIGSGYAEIFEGVSAKRFRRELFRRWKLAGGQRHLRPGSFDELVIRAAGLDLAEHATLHPGAMYRLFRPFWMGAASLEHVLEHTRTDLLPSTEHAVLDTLPHDFVAVRWYFRPSFPDTPGNRAFARRLTEMLAQTRPVVLLNTGLQLDDHQELLHDGEDFLQPLQGVGPAENLRLQSAIISRASMLCGTYGGLSYLAPMYGRPTVGFASNPEHLVMPHLEMGRAAARATGGSLSVFDPVTFETTWLTSDLVAAG